MREFSYSGGMNSCVARGSSSWLDWLPARYEPDPSERLRWCSAAACCEGDLQAHPWLPYCGVLFYLVAENYTQEFGDSLSGSGTLPITDTHTSDERQRDRAHT